MWQKNLKCDKTQKLKMRLNSKIPNLTKLTISKCNNLKTENVTTHKHKKWEKKVTKFNNSKGDKNQNLKCDETQKHKMWQNSKTQNLTKLKNSKCDKTQWHKMWQNSKSKNVAKLKKSQNVTKNPKNPNVTKKNCDKTLKKKIKLKNRNKKWQH